jgi:NADP-dependent 3-hydroxy acid dehydrogenase YdfG
MTTVSGLKNTVALVTGASSGIGRATALALAAEGATVALAGRRADRLEALELEISQAGGSAAASVVDITDRAQAERLVAETVERFGRLDTLVNNAGMMLLGPVESAPIHEWEQMIAVNVQGLLYCARAALPHLLSAAGDGPRQVADMVNISSVAGRSAHPGMGIYNLTKFGIGAFSESLRQEVSGRHVRVSLVEPGATATELRIHNRPEIQAQSAEYLKGVELLEASDIAESIIYIITRPRRMAINELLVRPTEERS